MKHSLIIHLILLVLLSFQSMAMANSAKDDLDAALSRLEEGTALLEEHDPRSNAILEESAAMIAQVIEEHEIRTPGIYHALGNAYMLSGDIGHAVLAYRKGEELDPTDTRLSESLAHARSLVTVSVKPDVSNRGWSSLLIWRGYIPRLALWVLFLSMFTIGWLACSARLVGFVSPRTRIAGIWLIAGSVIPVGMLGLEWARFDGSTSAVITDAHVIARSGPDDTIYDPVFTDAIKPGLEAMVLESRDGWNQLELADGSLCWVPEYSVEMVNP